MHVADDWCACYDGTHCALVGASRDEWVRWPCGVCETFGALEFGMSALSVADCDLTVMAHCYLIEANR